MTHNEYVHERVSLTCAAQHVPVLPSAAVIDVIAALIATTPPPNTKEAAA